MSDDTNVPHPTSDLLFARRYLVLSYADLALALSMPASLIHEWVQTSKVPDLTPDACQMLEDMVAAARLIKDSGHAPSAWHHRRKPDGYTLGATIQLRRSVKEWMAALIALLDRDKQERARLDALLGDRPWEPRSVEEGGIPSYMD